MKAHLAKYILVAVSALAVFLPFAVTPNTVLAQDTETDFSIESIGEQIGLGEADLKQTVLNIVQLVLGLMTLIAVVLVIYGGFVWLTSAGNEDNIEKAKHIISAAVVGLIIILLAWAVVIFVARTTANVTNTEDSTSF